MGLEVAGESMRLVGKREDAFTRWGRRLEIDVKIVSGFGCGIERPA